MKPVLQRLVALWAWLLAAALCLAFLPLSRSARLGLLLVVSAMLLLILRRAVRHSHHANATLFETLPDDSFSQPVVLCCGMQNSADAEPIYTLAQGCFIHIAESCELQHTVHQLLRLRPDWGRQISVYITIRPQQLRDNAALQNSLLALRWQLALLRRETGLALPLLLQVELAGAISRIDRPLWQLSMAGSSTQIWPDETAPRSVSEWLSAGGGAAMEQQILFNALQDWTQRQVLGVLTQPHQDIQPVAPLALMLLLQPNTSGNASGSLWAAWWLEHTAIHAAKSPSVQVASCTLPEFILPLLPQGRGVTPQGRALRTAVALFTVAALLALASAAWNNQLLIRRIAFDLEHYQRTAMIHWAAKLAAVKALRSDAAELDNIARHGVPLHLSLGLYQGVRLHLPVIQAISSWQPEPQPLPQTPPRPAPHSVRLNAMSLFDSGRAELKAGSTKMLVNALVDIKAKSGWLIVVAGHTDNTGNPPRNQRLSLQRAEAVRDWMRDTGDVPESCFAVQGYGENRPIARNDVPEGRAANRRVEISLIPQAGACSVSDQSPLSSLDGDGNHHEME